MAISHIAYVKGGLETFAYHGGMEEHTYVSFKFDAWGRL